MQSKWFKILLSTATITTLSASSLGLVSCHNKAISLWTKFEDNAQHDSYLNIIKSSHSKQWLNPQAKNLTLDNFQVNEKTKTIAIKIANSNPYSTATFTIQYHQNDKYNAANWVCNNDYSFQLSDVDGFPNQVKSLINNQMIDNSVNQITEINNTLYIGADGGLFQSSDGKRFIQNTTIKDLVHPSNPIQLIKKINKTIYVGTLYGLYQSNDDGTTFILNTSVNKLDSINKITIINHKIYIGTNSSGLYSSSDDGKNFARIDSAGDAVANQPNIYYTNTIIEEINHNIYIGNKKGNIFISTDDGKTFKKRYSFPHVSAITKIININGVIYIGTSIDSERLYLNSGLYTSTDMCKTCTKVNIVGYYDVIDIIDSNNDILVAVKNTDSLDRNTNTENGVYISHDGKSFTKFNLLNQNDHNNYIVGIKNINNILYVFANDKYYSSIDQKTFVTYNSDINNVGSFNNINYFALGAYLYVNQKLT